MSKKTKPSSNIRNIIDEVSHWYHNTEQWYEDSWLPGISCNELIENELINLDKLIKEKDEKIKVLVEALKHIKLSGYSDHVKFRLIADEALKAVKGEM